jgi:hypothetical protein
MDPEILHMPEVSQLTRIPMSTLRYRHSGQGPRSFITRRTRRIQTRRRHSVDRKPVRSSHRRQQPPDWSTAA